METTTLGFVDLIRGQLDAVEETMRAQSGLHHPSLDEAVEQLLASGGKRIRPAVVLLVGELLGVRGRGLVTLAAAIEMLHTATLVHDDLIDGSVLRRGAPTLNSRLEPGRHGPNRRLYLRPRRLLGLADGLAPGDGGLRPNPDDDR